MNCSQFLSRRRAAFTLTELLVVIAIIGVLAGLLLPVLDRIRETGRATTCLGHMRQIGTAWLAYTQEHNNTLPGPCYGGQNAYCKYGYDANGVLDQPNGALSAFLGPYLGITVTGISTFEPIFMCPTFQLESSAGKAGTNYILNTLVTTVNGATVLPFGYPPPTPSVPLRMTNLNFDLTKTWALTELDRNWYTGTTSGWYSTIPPQNRPLHYGFRNAIFFDCHAGHLTGPNNTPL